jgi:cell division protease FtsH
VLSLFLLHPHITHTHTHSLLGAAAALVPAAAARAADDAQGVASSRMSYSRFLEYLDMGRVKKVG